ncbi:hypothetical protein BI343_02340 [Chromobacterium amazonense]|nr:hypothetical protein BI343_02340 [Chromobacterium amazonense]
MCQDIELPSQHRLQRAITIFGQYIGAAKRDNSGIGLTIPLMNMANHIGPAQQAGRQVAATQNRKHIASACHYGVYRPRSHFGEYIEAAGSQPMLTASADVGMRIRSA